MSASGLLHPSGCRCVPHRNTDTLANFPNRWKLVYCERRVATPPSRLVRFQRDSYDCVVLRHLFRWMWNEVFINEEKAFTFRIDREYLPFLAESIRVITIRNLHTQKHRPGWCWRSLRRFRKSNSTTDCWLADGCRQKVFYKSAFAGASNMKAQDWNFYLDTRDNK